MKPPKPLHDTPSFWRAPAGLALVVALAAAGFYLVSEHAAHLYGLLPYALLLACPLMHVFMHRGRDHHHPRSDDDGQQR